MPERNAPCPCGSGKKYKKCCNLNTVRAHAPDTIAINRAVAYKGEVGRRRLAFCEAYTIAKKEGLANVEAKLRQSAEEMGKTITCHKGCGHCCDIYVFANLQESENIVHYLYEHEETFQYYLRQYPRWKEKIGRLGATMPNIDKMQEKVLFGIATEDDRRAFNDGLTAYATLRNPCPFLRDNACTIYEVRPYVCAGVVSINPPGHCIPDNPTSKENMLMKADYLPQNDIPYFMPAKAAINFGCMPALVYQIIKYGYAFLSTIEGLEDLQRLATGDPAVRATLAWPNAASLRFGSMPEK
ncbi:MAG: YkgJ family cysteine cluster protein [Dehalococcoidia bacterium]|nr:YkgJ family cysteine cluster protein [Dehalococcoidia bacterium]